ncbi:GNAT family N-acetyltransferase [Paracoccus alkenifer]|uniref:Putative acetyltransferase n=1 Tax=Paracoccus alkenifer TaxID=65735 RepID=A0A1H6J6A5_9RHOB|nr:N-acetyltransferase [Paracoccus alkenifer]SEH57497.1 putative acetyltransferase [Paracoccus alkenifer]
MTAAHPRITIRPETAADIQPIARLLDAAFGGAAESRLVEALRADGDLALSLVAEDAGGIVGHLALSPVAAPFPALALAPLAVTPGQQRRGIGAALVAAAQGRRPDATIIVLGDPAYYAGLGFRPVGWDCAFSGPCLQAAGPHLPVQARLDYAPAFSREFPPEES